MIRRPPRSTRTDTLFPYTTLFRSWWATCLRKISPVCSTPISAERLASGATTTLMRPCSLRTYATPWRSAEHTSELQSLLRLAYAVLFFPYYPYEDNHDYFDFDRIEYLTTAV